MQCRYSTCNWEGLTIPNYTFALPVSRCRRLLMFLVRLLCSRPCSRPKADVRESSTDTSNATLMIRLERYRSVPQFIDWGISRRLAQRNRALHFAMFNSGLVIGTTPARINRHSLPFHVHLRK